MDDNPYISPREVEPGGRRRAGAASETGPSEFVPATRRARLAMAMIALNVLGSTLMAAFCLAEAGFLSRFIAGDNFEVGDAEIAQGRLIDSLVRACSFTLLPTYWLSVIAFLVWLYRAYRNLPALGAANSSFHPAGQSAAGSCRS